MTQSFFIFPQAATKTPSTYFCLLLRLFTLRCTEKQMKLMLNHVDSPYIRCIGFLYLRYASEPSGLWEWFEPYLYDQEPVRIEVQPSKPEVTVGDYVRSLLTEMDYYRTLLPRLPVTIEREIKVKLLKAEKIEERAKSHAKDSVKMEYFQRVGNKIQALYGDEDNPTTWYNGVIDRVIFRDDESGLELLRPKLTVTFPEYGNTEIVSLGEVDMLSNRLNRSDDDRLRGSAGNSRDSERGHDRGRDRNYHDSDRQRDHDKHDDSRNSRGYSRDNYDTGRDKYDSRRGYDSRGHSGSSSRNERELDRRDRPYAPHRNERDSSKNDRRSRSRDREFASIPNASAQLTDEKELMEEVRRREREKTAAKGKAYAARPATFKNSLAVQRDGVVERKRSCSPEHFHAKGAGHNGHQNNSFKENLGRSEESKISSFASLQKTPEELAATDEKRRKLTARYG
eukprot:CAMPEP_0197842612 /NCGR_PEP_ID=MMETSP1437-20131217/46833_1 /TAXON_ID=49252 ORGANISM="Eucampia antarctica, Strain CCMP1452" /NCGR_SAMPLE_ID=MMETSP1437 /ASSEMBLY_ACC=CAM_ASM_001096 /LENGTH=452 /DNA_ID=CAMNT_0043452507 /DNA_START=441 /DNA_END=1798 /DNA_ORIENTATION=+